MGNRFDTINNNLRLAGNTTATTVTGNLSVSGGIQPSTPFMFRNKIINGDMRIDQRYGGASTTFTTSAWAYCLDRWRCYTISGVAGSANISQVTTDDLGETFNYLRFNQTVATTVGSPYISQPIENIRIFNGNTVTLSFKARTASGTASVTSGFGKHYGSGGSTVEYSAQKSHPLTTSWQTFTQTETLTTNAGKTIGAGSHLEVYFAFPALTTFDIHITDIQLEEGSVATPFERRPLGLELALCQRYYQNVSEAFDVYTSWGSSGGYGAMVYSHKVSMRTAPTLNVISISGGSFYSSGGGKEATYIFTSGLSGSSASAIKFTLSSEI